MSDAINRPAHYTQGSIECIDAIRSALGQAGFVAFCRGNAIKYAWRTGAKDDAAQDAAKAAWYTQMAAHVLAPDRHADPRGAP
jgi:hypothetical protein